MSLPLRLRRLDERTLHWPDVFTSLPDVRNIVDSVRERGDDALADAAKRFGDPPPRRIDCKEMRAAFQRISPDLKQALVAAQSRIARFAAAQLGTLTDLTLESSGMQMGHRITPVRSVGAYIPGGRHPLPSSLLMCVVPALIAGVRGIVVCSPSAVDETLAAAHICGVEQFYLAGGAQSVAAMAFGTAMISSVDLIVGPGNAYVTAAKRQVYGVCGIDNLSGPSEILIVASADANPRLVAADLLAQAEHDAVARVLLITEDEIVAQQVQREMNELLKDMPTADTARASIDGFGGFIVTTLDCAIDIANRLAPEHLALHGAAAEGIAMQLHTYGTLFIGDGAAEVFGDYGIGPNHVLATCSTARFSSGLSVFTFLRARTFVMSAGVTETEVVQQTALLARTEGLHAHEKAALLRRTC